MGNLVLFLILVEMVSVFHHWEWCWLWVCHIWPLLCWIKFLLCLLSEVFIINGCWILSKAFSASIEIIIRFFSFNLLMFYHFNWFAYIEESLHSRDKPHLIMVYDPFNVLLESICCILYFVENFWIYVHQWYWPVVFFLCDIFVWFWYQGDGGLIEWVWECFSLCYILEEFDKDRCLIFSKCLIEFSCEATWSWAFVCWKIF